MKTWMIAPPLLLSILSSPVRAEDPPAEAWVRSWNAPANHEDNGRIVAVDAQTWIYVAGDTYEPQGSWEDLLLLQYDPAGNLSWFRRYGGPFNDAVSDLLVPAPGEVVMTGLVTRESGVDVATLKYDQAGNLLWDRLFPVQDALFDVGSKLAVDGDGNILVSAVSGGDYQVLKYTPDGTLAWSRSYDGPAGTLDVATDVAAGPDGSVYVIGTANSSHAYATVKFSADGVFQWEQIETGDIASVFPGCRVAVGPDGDVVVVGNPESICGVFQFKVWKCDAATGSALWSDKQPSAPCGSFILQDMALDEEGNVVAVCSGREESSPENHFQVLKYSPGGTHLWTRMYDGPGTSEDIAAGIATDRWGGVYAAGYTTFPPQNRDFAAVKYTPDGVEAWSVTWASAAGTNDIGEDIAVDPTGDVIVTGHSFDPLQNENVVTVKYDQPGAAEVAEPALPAALERPLAVSPIPLAEGATIRYGLPRDGEVLLQVISADGRVVRTLVDGTRPAGVHDLRWDRHDAAGSRLPPGAYLIRMSAGGTRASAKAILLP